VKKYIINIIDRARAHYVWAKEIEESSANSLTAWSMVCQQKENGGKVF
jgi:hypothetical protein